MVRWSWWEGECNGRSLDLKIFRGRLPKKKKVTFPILFLLFLVLASLNILLGFEGCQFRVRIHRIEGFG